LSFSSVSGHDAQVRVTREGFATSVRAATLFFLWRSRCGGVRAVLHEEAHHLFFAAVIGEAIAEQLGVEREHQLGDALADNTLDRRIGSVAAIHRGDPVQYALAQAPGLVTEAKQVGLVHWKFAFHFWGWLGGDRLLQLET
jgi:hypothetical protein